MDGADRGVAGVRRIQLSREGDPAFEGYLALCSDYLKRQLIVYRNWPQRRWDAMGYRSERVFRDRNT